MGIVDSLSWVVMERMAGEREMGRRDEGWRRDGRMLGAGRDGDAEMENDFEDGSHLYRFLEHETAIPRCFNFRRSTNDAAVGQKLTKIMSAILEAYASDDRIHVDYTRISKSEEFRW
ncbi:hypothetical protein MRB53_001138 [Persea americana]|uniref:Uncharacterized protein n=1 Tax=Persea americana TaxID=3435 RepID=A0ACC2MQV7_PERAE|nr:hypothetical protein MRB53_001138 [Persea americana]